MKTEPNLYSEHEIHESLEYDQEVEGLEKAHDEEFVSAQEQEYDENRPMWWATWRSVLNDNGQTTITEIAEGLDVFGKYHIEKLSDYSGQHVSSRPTLSAWLNVYQGRIGFETYVIYMAAQDRWLTVSGLHYLDLKHKPDPIPVSDALKDRGKIDQVYRVSEKQTLDYSAGYKDGYELGMSHTWVKARDAARKDVWKNAFEQGKEQALIGKTPSYSESFTRIMATSSFVAGIAVATLLHVFSPMI